MTVNDRDFLRTTVRTRRRELSHQEQKQAAEQLVMRAIPFLLENQVHCISLYLACDGELDTQPLIKWCWQNNIHVCLPVLHPLHEGHLLFLSYTAETPMQLNRFRIPEPQMNCAHIVPKENIDIIFTPLVAFDAEGNRLGMGGGFYDRTLENWQQTKRPFPVGLAHDCQQVDLVPTEMWDVPLPVLITPSRCWQWSLD
jgi:5-formyltetrahydrofolate cyclo-ligase